MPPQIRFESSITSARILSQNIQHGNRYEVLERC